MKWQGYLLIIFLFFLPLFFPPILADKYDFPKILLFYLFISSLLIISGFWLSRYQSYCLPAKKFLLFLLLFLLIYFLSTLGSIQPLTSLFGYPASWTGAVFFLGGLLIIFFVSFNLLRQNQILDNLLIYLVSSGFLAAVYGLYQFFSRFLNQADYYRIRSTIGEPNRLALFLLAILPLSFVLSVKQKTFIRQLLAILVFLVILWALILTQSRSAWLTLLISLFMAVVLAYKKKGLTRILAQSKKPFLWLFFLTLLLLFYQKRIISQRLTAIYYDLKNQTQSSTNIRLNEWQTAGKIVLKRKNWWPIFFGSGPQTTYYLFLKEKAPPKSLPVNQRSWRTLTIRNQYLETLVNIGFFGLASYLLVVGFIFNEIWKSKSKNPAFWAFGFSWITVVISNFFYYQTVVGGLFFWVLAAAILTNSTKPLKIELKKSFFCCLGLVCLGFICLVATLVVFLADIYASRSKIAMAVKLNPYNGAYWNQLSYQLADQAIKSKNVYLLNQAIKAGQRSLSLNNLEPQNLAALQKVYYLGGTVFDKKFQLQALNIANQWIKLDPTNSLAYDNLGLIFLDLNQLPQALANFQKAIENNPDFFIHYLHLAETSKQMGEVQTAKKFYQQALRLNPDSFEAQKGWETINIIDKK